jgi:hypothetical protein
MGQHSVLCRMGEDVSPLKARVDAPVIRGQGSVSRILRFRPKGGGNSPISSRSSAHRRHSTVRRRGCRESYRIRRPRAVGVTRRVTAILRMRARRSKSSILSRRSPSRSTPKAGPPPALKPRNWSLRRSSPLINLLRANNSHRRRRRRPEVGCKIGSGVGEA